ncbi:alpha/beta-hydrolase [Schizophyllum commune Loenen D]|nr:alpha/beta-hydrolase [Schizophyllum commune Loenen D]
MQNTLRLSALLATCGLAPSAPITVGGTTLTEFEVTFPSQMSLTFFAPVGEPRFSPPVPHILNGSALDATSFGPASPQPTDGGVPVEKQPEDCLTINIMRPTGISSDAALPVVWFWVFGGGFYSGDALIFDSSLVVARSVERGTPVIIVSFRYHLGPLGLPRAILTLTNTLDTFASLAWCAGTSGSVLDCHPGADSEAVMAAVRQASDGANNVAPGLPSKFWAAGGYTQGPSSASAHLDDGTWFAPAQISIYTLLRLLLEMLLSPTILALYPDDPALGSPYDTGSETFDLSSTSGADNRCSTPVLIHFEVGDDIIPLGAPVLQRGSSKVGAPTYGYLLADPRLDHGVDVRYMFHNLTNAALETSVLLSEQVMDYWLSFNGLGVDHSHWPVHHVGRCAYLSTFADDHREG